MDEHQREQLANSRAQAYAPKPTGGAVMAGVCGASLVLLGYVIASRFYGWPLGDYVWVAVIAAISGFLVGWIGYLRLARLNQRARHAEREQIDDEQDR